jgi:hypothetical protein
MAVIGGAAPASAVTLATAIDANNGQDGVMFDVVVGANALTLTSLGILTESGNGRFEFYTIEGGIGSNLSNPSAWTLRDSFGLTSSGGFSFTSFDITDFTLNANTTYGLYFTETGNGDGIQYTNASAVGDVRTSNSDLSILVGYGREYLFQDIFQPRAFNGSLTYTVGDVIPEPASWAMLIAGFGLVGGAMRRRRQGGAWGAARAAVQAG